MQRRLAALAVAMVLGASACTGSATVTQTGETSPDSQAEPTAEQTVEIEPTAAPLPDETPTPSDSGSTPETTPAPPGPAAVALPLDAFRTDAILALSNDAVYAYAGTSSPWNNPTSCDSAPVESLAVVDLAAAAAGEAAAVAGGLEQTGDVRQMIFSADGTAAILSSCGPVDDATVWLQRGTVGSDGRLNVTGEPMVLTQPGESDPYIVRWSNNDLVDVRVIIEQDPDDFETWLIERRLVAVADGQVVSVEQFDYFADDGVNSRAELVTERGTYRVIDDPAGRLGCEGFGVAVTLEFDAGGERRIALTQPDFVFSDISDLHVSPDGYISWTSGCEGFISSYVGRILDDGTIADAHLIETFSLFSDTYVEFERYRLSGDGFLHAIGQSFDPDVEGGELYFFRYDLRSDPHFVNTAEPALQIDQEPLLAAVGGDGTWHVGDTLAAESACGARTLYGQTPGGFFRAFPAGVEMDAIVAIDAGETQRISYPDGDFVSRTIVVQTECPGSYEGRRVWFGLETDNIIWGLSLDRADLGEVADVLAVRDVLREGTDFVETSIVQVELLDGTVAEVELVRLPREG